jgi:hypothetical protein
MCGRGRPAHPARPGQGFPWTHVTWGIVEWCGVLYENLYLILLLISPVGKHTVLLLLLGVLV